MPHTSPIFQDTNAQVKKLRYFFEALLVRSMVWIFPRLPRRALLLAARLVGTLAYWVDWKGRPTALANLHAAFGDEMTATRARSTAIASYQNFARTFFDLFWSPRMTHQNWQQHATLECDPQIDATVRKRGAVVLTPHFGNFEFMGLLLGFRGFAMTVIAQDFKNPKLTDIFSKLRGGSGNNLVPQQSAILRLARALAKKGVAAMLADLTIKPSSMSGVVEAFGLPTSVTLAHCQLAQRFNAPLLLCLCYPNDDGSYQGKVLGLVEAAPAASPSDLAQQCWDIFEPHIRQRPELWLWMYKHWRYLPGDQRDARYPAYANRHKAFAANVGK
jgi:Kdo2-lipid IVA lauroyltransferase/acyltransferase